MMETDYQIIMAQEFSDIGYIDSEVYSGILGTRSQHLEDIIHVHDFKYWKMRLLETETHMAER